MNRDPRVMKFFPRPFTAKESNAFITDNACELATHGWGNWAVEVIGSGAFAGFVGLSVPPGWHPCGGRPEIGWRLDPGVWGMGYATEAARKVLEAAFEIVGLDEIISYSATCNSPSIAVMRKLGMSEEFTFAHPRIPGESELCNHVVYRLARASRASARSAFQLEESAAPS